MDEKDEDFIEALISQVSLHDVIYNKRNSDHHRTQCVEAAWVEISAAVNKDPKWCAEKWKNLQRNYRNFINKENLPSGSAAPSRGRPKFGYAQQMSFLLEHIQPKETKSNWKRKDNSQETFIGSDSSGVYPGGSQSSKSFRGLSQHNQEIEEWDGSKSVSEPVKSGKQAEPEPRYTFTPQHPFQLEDESSSSEENVSVRKRQKLNSIDESPEIHLNRSAAVDYEPEDLVEVVPSDTLQPVEEQQAVRTKVARSKKRKPNKPKSRKQEIVKDRSPDKSDLESDFYRQMTAAAGSITTCFQHNPKVKEKPSDADAIINHFCKMQKYMLRTINIDARLEYIKECTDKLTRLCQLESHII